MEKQTGLQKLLESLINQSNGCGQGTERYILNGIIDYTKKLVEEEKIHAASKDDEILTLTSILHDVLYAKDDDAGNVRLNAEHFLKQYISEL